MLLIGLSLTSTAVAQDEPLSQKVDAGQWVQARVDSWLIPEATADRCLALEGEVTALQGGLDKCLAEGRTALGEAKAALEVCQGRIAEDGAELARCQGAEATLLISTDRLKRQRNQAYVVAGVSVAGLLTAGAVAIGQVAK